MVTIVVPLIVLAPARTRRSWPSGLVFAVSGVAGMIAALIAGRLDTRGREWDLLVLPMGGIAAADLLLLVGRRGDGRDGRARRGGPRAGDRRRC